MTNNPGFNGNQGYQPGYGPSGYNQPYRPQTQNTPAFKKGPNKLVIVACILAALCLLLSAGLVYMFVNQDKSDITKGIVPAGELLELEIPELDADAFSPYTLFLPEEDAAVIIMQTANGAKMQKFITATTKKTAEKVGDLIDLPACPTNSTRPYVVKGSDVVCSEKPVMTKNENKNYEFNETVYTSETIIIGASPSAAEATQIVAYQPGKEEPLWVENLNTPASVSTNGETIYTATTNEDGKIDIQGYVGAENQTEEQTAKPSKKVLAPDFMKNYDFANTYLPNYFDLIQNKDTNFCGELRLPDSYYKAPGSDSNGSFPFVLSPNEETNCWAKLENGTFKKTFDNNGHTQVGRITYWSNLTDPQYKILENYSGENGSSAAFIDINNDGYLDALAGFGFGTEDINGVGMGGSEDYFIFLANPEDPERPYVGIYGPLMPGRFVYEKEGTITVRFPQNNSISASARISDREITIKQIDGKPVGNIKEIS